MSRFSLRSDVTMADSTFHEPWSIPPSVSNVAVSVPPTVSSSLFVPVLKYVFLPEFKKRRSLSMTASVTLTYEPIRTKFRTDNEEPRWKKSNTDKPDPNRALPNTLAFPPRRPKLLIDIVEPSCKKSITDSDAPRRAKVLRDREEPRCAISKIDTDEPIRVTPSMEIEDAIREQHLRDKVEPRCKKSSTDN
mmetsp:Transcript_78227/g.148684  ORF Transcript_78227/g.148684 Transcript_78227/m.148684 type:complete len:191 (+) Transcript_78227:805-1377(+)